MKLLEGLDLGSKYDRPLHLKNRMAMAPMTRSRADAAGNVGPMHVTYYQQRASAGLLITEGVNISKEGVGSPLTPGLYEPSHIAAWTEVTKAVHAAGGRIFAQLWHTGRVGHSLVKGGELPVAPSAIRIEGQKHFTSQGPQDYETPRALETSEVKAVVEDYRTAAKNALAAGFDGVELHGAFGYLPNQFLVDGANKRTDAYGGSIENRCRFVVEVMQALVDVWGPGRAAIKLSPSIPYNGMIDSDPTALFTHLIGELNKLPLAYVQMMQAMFPLDHFPTWPKDPVATFGPMITTTVMANGGYDRAKGEAALESGAASLISYGALFISNPDLPHRFEVNAELAAPDRATMYGGSEKGFIDYPALAR